MYVSLYNVRLIFSGLIHLQLKKIGRAVTQACDVTVDKQHSNLILVLISTDQSSRSINAHRFNSTTWIFACLTFLHVSSFHSSFFLTFDSTHTRKKTRGKQNVEIPNINFLLS